MQKRTITYDEFQTMVRNAPPGSGINAQSIAASIEKKGYALPPELSQFSTTQPKENESAKEGFFSTVASSLQKRNQAAFGSSTGLVESALNPSRTSKTDSAAGRMLRGEQGLLQTAFDVAGQGAGAIGDIVGAGVSKVVGVGDYLLGGVPSKIAGAVAESEVGQAVGSAVEDVATQYERFKTAYPDAARNLENTVNIASLIPLAKPAAAAAGMAKRAGKSVMSGVKSKLPSYFDDIAKQGVPEKTIVDALKNTNIDEASLIREGAEATKPAVSWREKIAGVRPDIKKRIARKQDKLKEYFNISHARNLDDTVPTPLEYGAKSVEKARNELQKVMNDTGGKIGQFRQKIATIQAGIDDLNSIEKSFVESLDSLNLSVKNGSLVRKAGKVSGKVSDSEVRTLQGIYDDILRVKAAPSSQNLIDLRNAVQDKINFAKTSKEASNVVDPLARRVRSTIRDVNLKMVGKEQGALLDEYSDLASVLEEMNSFVDSKTGGEFLLKRVLSERGRIPREVMQKVAKYTGVDLMDDATMAQLATEIVGNSAQKGLFRQEITRAGLDAMDVLDALTGAPGGTVRSGLKLLEKSSNIIAPTEKMFLKAAK